MFSTFTASTLPGVCKLVIQVGHEILIAFSGDLPELDREFDVDLSRGFPWFYSDLQ